MEFIEPFAGGGIVSLTVAFEQLAHHVTIAELDADVAAVWLTMLSPEAEWLANQIAAFDFAPDTVNYILSQSNISTKEKAFQTILKNRINRGGIMAQGAGKIKLGEQGNGLKSRSRNSKEADFRYYVDSGKNQFYPWRRHRSFVAECQPNRRSIFYRSSL